MDKSTTVGNVITPGTTFLPALAAAWSYLLARSHRLLLSLAEAVSCTTIDLVSLMVSGGDGGWWMHGPGIKHSEGGPGSRDGTRRAMGHRRRSKEGSSLRQGFFKYVW
ncbi:hypothetical protein ZWY2020_021931 [Hordeum vulgare]|nr:hypothetical protein ZWY2020_021931 [Hordeum vulgare]